MKDTTWEVGQKVAWFNSNDDFIFITEIKGLHKNGNIITKHSTQQFKPYETSAVATGSGWSRPQLKPLSPAVMENVHRQVAYKKWKSLLRKAEAISSPTEAQIEALQEIVGE